MIVAGVDIGSVATKAVIVVEGRVAGRAMTRTGVNPPQAGEEVLSAALREAGLAADRLDRTVTTGYGRRAVRFGDGVVTEITAAGRGAWSLGAPWGAVRTVIDLGGQDSKVILMEEARPLSTGPAGTRGQPDSECPAKSRDRRCLEEPGVVSDFAMNDKCAAGTGRFLEVMAGVLGVELGEMGALSLRATDPVTINSTCTVFAESEVISLIAQGRRPADIAAGIHNSIASRLLTMVRQLDGDRAFFCGGGARNVGVQAALREALQAEVYVPTDPQFVVALGAALIASDQFVGQGQQDGGQMCKGSG